MEMNPSEDKYLPLQHLKRLLEEISEDLVEEDSEDDNDNEEEYDENEKLIDIDFKNTEITAKLQSLITDAESAINSGQRTVMFSGLELKVNSKDLKTVKKCNAGSY